MTSVDGSCIKEGISMVGKEYFVLKEDIIHNLIRAPH
jgi:hypothetical protein